MRWVFGFTGVSWGCGNWWGNWDTKECLDGWESKDIGLEEGETVGECPVEQNGLIVSFYPSQT